MANAIELFGQLGRLTFVGMVSDEDDLKRFLVERYPSVLRTVTLASESEAAAQDAVHEAIARGWVRRGDIAHFDRWVMTVALNLSRSRWRHVLRSAPRAAPKPNRSADDMATVEWLLVLRSLPTRQRQVAVLRYVEDLSLAEIAEIVGTSEGAVKNALFHARRSLAEQFEIIEVEEINE
jgi:RNA polymerase sigma-70 factor (ECF subfamily)